MARQLRFFLLASALALALRMLFLCRFEAVVTDSFVYGDIAKNWLVDGIYGLSGAEEISATYIRLPGYPAFLASIFATFGLDHYRAALIVQILVDLGTCFSCADLARRELGPRWAKTSFLLAGLCPFLANYSAAALTETLEVFTTALALNFASRAMRSRSLGDWGASGLGCAASILLRPDGMLLLIAMTAYLAAAIASPARLGQGIARQRLLQAALLVTGICLLCLLPWTVRNWRVFHRFQPLAPRYANEENEFVPMGFNRWVKTWIVDYASVEEIYWAVPGSPIDYQKLPPRAFDNARQQTLTRLLIEDYNRLLHISRPLDDRFQRLADERIATSWFRYYAVLPLLRTLDMWLRPRTEMLPCDTRWWKFDDEPRWSALAVSLGAINLVYVFFAIVGAVRWRAERRPGLGLLLLFVILRSAFLGSLENPEPRYTLEMYPVVIVLAGFGLVRTSSSARLPQD